MSTGENDTKDSEANTDQKKQEVDFDSMTPEELNKYVETQKNEVIKLNSIIERKGKVVADLNQKVTDVDENSNVDKNINKEVSAEDLPKRLELKVEYGYPDVVIDHIMSLGGKKALDNPLTKQVADKMAQDYKSQQATDIPEGPNSTVDRRIKVSDLEGMSSEEMEKILPHKE